MDSLHIQIGAVVVGRNLLKTQPMSDALFDVVVQRVRDAVKTPPPDPLYNAIGAITVANDVVANKSLPLTERLFEHLATTVAVALDAIPGSTYSHDVDSLVASFQKSTPLASRAGRFQRLIQWVENRLVVRSREAFLAEIDLPEVS